MLDKHRLPHQCFSPQCGITADISAHKHFGVQLHGFKLYHLRFCVLNLFLVIYFITSCKCLPVNVKCTTYMSGTYRNQRWVSLDNQK